MKPVKYPDNLPLVRMFSPELRTASVVPRWSVVWTLTRDTVANHSFYVTLYAANIAHVIGWAARHPKELSALMFMALTHDLDETITGDIVSPVKDQIIDPDRFDDFVRAKMRERLPYVAEMTDIIEDDWPPFLWDGAQAIIKVADRLDALLFLIGEQRMGNGVIASRIPLAMTRLRAAWLELPNDGPTPVDLEQLWIAVMVPVIEAHRNEGGHGV